MSSLHFFTCLDPNNSTGVSLCFSLFRTDALLVKLSMLVGQQVFYGALWGSMLVSPMVRLPASVFIVTHFDRMVSLRQQTHMLGYDHSLVVSLCYCAPLLQTTSKHDYSLLSAPSPCRVFCLNTSPLVCLQVKSVCLCLQDSNVLVQRNMLEILLYLFPIASCLVGTRVVAVLAIVPVINIYS